MTNSKRTSRCPVQLKTGSGTGPRPGGWETLPYSTLGHVEGGNSCGGYTMMGVLRHTPANGPLVYSSQCGMYRAEGCVALG